MANLFFTYLAHVIRQKNPEQTTSPTETGKINLWDSTKNLWLIWKNSIFFLTKKITGIIKFQDECNNHD